MTEFSIDGKILQFVHHLEDLEPGERARFKRNAGSGLSQAREVTTLFYRLLPAGVPAAQEEAFFLVATLFPLAAQASAGNLGDALRRARKEKQNDKGLDRRLEVLLDANEEQLPFRLRQAVHFLQSNRVAVNWAGLLADLLQWDHPLRLVQRRWARAYFKTSLDDGAVLAVKPTR
jgi:CRISPR type I-E-associated protein CasB/Cse2